jgi:hypothetical protein
LDGKEHEARKIIPGQKVKATIVLFENKLDIWGDVHLETTDVNGQRYHIKQPEIAWLPTVMDIKIEMPQATAIKEAQNDLDIYKRETKELKELFEKNGFRVVDTSARLLCALEVTKKDVTARIWIDQDEKGVSYQAGYKENPFGGNKRHCKKREVLLRQVNTIITEVISGTIWTIPFHRIGG